MCSSSTQVLAGNGCHSFQAKDPPAGFGNLPSAQRCGSGVWPTQPHLYQIWEHFPDAWTFESGHCNNENGPQNLWLSTQSGKHTEKPLASKPVSISLYPLLPLHVTTTRSLSSALAGYRLHVGLLAPAPPGQQGGCTKPLLRGFVHPPVQGCRA